MVDFRSVKERFDIEKVAQLLGLQLRQAGQAFRGPCPACESGGERALVITPAKGVWYCWTAHVGGDQLALAAHIRKTEVKDAAEWLDGGKSDTKPERKEGTFQPLDLDHEHAAVVALGFEPADAEQLGIGFASKGIMKGLVAIPIRLPSGDLAGYIGVSEIEKLPPRWHLGNVVPIKKTA
jgi:DNA primase